jgi:HEAT repeat protein
MADAARALGKKGHPDAAGPLIHALKEEQRSVRFAVIEALLALGPLSVGPLKDALAKEHKPELKKLMVRVLEEIERQAEGLEPTPTKELLEMSAEMLDSLVADLSRQEFGAHRHPPPVGGAQSDF